MTFDAQGIRAQFPALALNVHDKSLVYLDNAATSNPKPTCVHEAMVHFARDLGASPGRGAYQESKEAGRLLSAARERVNRLIGGRNPNHVIFTLNCSDALNLAIHGVLCAEPNQRPHAITTQMDHNSVLRPLNKLADAGEIDLTILRADPKTGRIDPADLDGGVLRFLFHAGSDPRHSLGRRSAGPGGITARLALVSNLQLS